MDVIDLAQKLIQFDSVTPKGADCLDFIQQHLKSQDFEVTRLPFGAVDNLFARKGQREPHIMFIGHVDVVPPGDNWHHSPFAGVIENDILYGRGAVDMKGAIAAFLAAICEIEISGSISVLLTTDEEGPAKDGIVKIIPWLEKNHHVPTYALVGEPTCVDYVGDTVKNGRRGSISFDIQTFGTQGHVAYPSLANNAANPLLELLNFLISTPLDRGTADFEPSNLEVVKLGMPNSAYNVISGEAHASVNVRFNTLHTFTSLTQYIEDIAKKIEEIYGADFAITPLPSAEPFISASSKWAEIVASAIEAELGQRPDFSTSGGTSDARFIQKICPVLELGLLNQTAHKVDEHTCITDIMILRNLYRRVLKSMI